MRRRRSTPAVAVAAVLALSAAPSPASADVAWQPCTDPGFTAFECGRLAVPVDRSGGVPGTIDLFARRLVAPANPTRTAVVVLAGGPGQAAAPLAAQLAVVLAPALGERDLIAYDQRGTGASSPLRCAAVGRTSGSQRSIAADCANEIGPQRGFFRTAESVADIEDLRAQAGYDRLVLMGTSYGTKVALAYAARFPERVERLVLDSVVTPEGPDALRRSSFGATGRVLSSLCGEGRCSGVTPTPVGDVRALVRRETIRGRYRDLRGRRRRASIEAGSIYELLELGDVNPAWRALLPGAVRSAVLGDETPLLRLGATMFGVAAGGPQVPDGGVNRALFLSTICEELLFPWDRNAGADARIDQAIAALAAIPESVFSPFDRRAAAQASLVPLCYGWPNGSPPPEPPGPLPNVPALVLSGEADVRTPAEDANAVAERLGATAVVVPHTGHSVLGSDFSGCARAAVAAFFRDGSTPACLAGAEPPIGPVLRPPRNLRAVPEARRYKGRIGRTLNAVALTQRDALVAAAGAQLDGMSQVPGTRRGRIVVTPTGTALRGVEHVPGVRVTGTYPDAGSRARLRITGSVAAHGRLTVFRNGTVRGVLGGRRIRARPRSASAGGAFGGPPSSRRLVPFPALLPR
jgi:pimeloyl-ACP methyl ester carboxylesterase